MQRTIPHTDPDASRDLDPSSSPLIRSSSGAPVTATRSAPARSALAVGATVAAAVAVASGAAGCSSDGVGITVGDAPEPPAVSVVVDPGRVSVSVAARTDADGDTVGRLEPVTDGTAELPDGWFEMVGYGTVLHVAGDQITAHHVTDSTCVVGDRFENALPVDHADQDDGVIVIDLVGPTTDYRLVRLTDGIECDGGGEDSLVALDEVFRAHYPFFAERDVDWDAALAQVRSTVAADPSAFEPALAELMVDLGDGHTALADLSIDPEIDRYDMPELTTIDDVAAAMDAELDATLERVDGLRTDPTGTVGWGTLADRIGYLVITRFHGPNGDEDPVGDRDAFARAMDTAIADLSAHADRLVVDVRFDEGGEEDLAVLAAGYFVGERTPAYRKWAYAQPDPFVQVIEVDPRTVRFEGDVVVLTSPVTASAAEVFALSMVEVADATVIGNRSFGEFSDAIDWVLPNGVELTLSMEVYTDLDGVGHEVVGVPVDIETPFDEGLDVAIDHLR